MCGSPGEALFVSFPCLLALHLMVRVIKDSVLCVQSCHDFSLCFSHSALVTELPFLLLLYYYRPCWLSQELAFQLYLKTLPWLFKVLRNVNKGSLRIMLKMKLANYVMIDVVGYFVCTPTLPRLTIKFTLSQRVELATSWPKIVIEVLEDQGHIERQRK